MKRVLHKKDKLRRQRLLFKKENGYYPLTKWKIIPYSRLFRYITYYSDWYTDEPYTYNGQTRQLLKHISHDIFRTY